jgi:Na+-translocating ferredoxin:NAD+ oxidoreductase RnfD subunit
VTLKRFYNDTRIQVSFTLFLVWLLALWNFRSDPTFLRVIFYPLLAITVVIISDLELTFIRFRKFYFPTAAVVSGFLIGLILAPTESIHVIIIASLIASLSKQFIATGVRRHIFNPAAFGIMATYFLFDTTVSWWGISWGWYPLIILVPLMARILWKLKRLFIPFSFLAIYASYLSIFSSAESSLRILTDPTILLFALVMLPEPITSPTYGYFKYIFGGLVALISIFISGFLNLSEIFLPALLVANLGSFLIIRFIQAKA